MSPLSPPSSKCGRSSHSSHAELYPLHPPTSAVLALSQFPVWVPSDHFQTTSENPSSPAPNFPVNWVGERLFKFLFSALVLKSSLREPRFSPVVKGTFLPKSLQADSFRQISKLLIGEGAFTLSLKCGILTPSNQIVSPLHKAPDHLPQGQPLRNHFRFLQSPNPPGGERDPLSFLSLQERLQLLQRNYSFFELAGEDQQPHPQSLARPAQEDPVPDLLWKSN